MGQLWDEAEAIGRHRLYSQRSASTLLMKVQAFLPSSPRYRAPHGLGRSILKIDPMSHQRTTFSA